MRISIEEIEEYADDPQLTYTFFGGVPVSLTQRIAPWQISNRTMYSAFFAQDQWTLKRLTLQGAVRYDRALELVPGGSQRRAGRLTYGIRRPSRSRDPTASVPTTTSRREWAWRMTCSATARRRSG